MARRKKKEPVGVGSAWLVTFADLMTLLLTFFVLLLSMASLTVTSLLQVNTFFAPRNFISQSGPGNIPQRIEIIMEQLREPDALDFNPQRIKDLLYPLDELPAEVDRGKLEKNLEVLKKEEGIVIVLTDALLFDYGQYELSEENKKFLKPLYDVLLYSNSDINITGYTDNRQARAMSNYELSGLRALSVLEYFLQEANSSKALKPSRFSISGYGPDRPIDTNDTESGRARNNRVEILLKNDQWLEGRK